MKYIQCKLSKGKFFQIKIHAAESERKRLRKIKSKRNCKKNVPPTTPIKTTYDNIDKIENKWDCPFLRGFYQCISR